MLARILSPLSVLLLAVSATAQIQFEPLVEIPIPHNAIDVDIADLDGDGNVDLLTTPTIDNVFADEITYVVVPGLGDASFGTPVSGQTLPYRIVGSGEATDIDGDGSVEWVLPRAYTFGDALLFEDTPGLTFGAPATIGGTFVNGAAALRVVDLLGDDDHLDVIMVGSNSAFGFDPDSSFVAMVADGLGGFTQTAGGAVQDGTHGLAVGDLNGDGLLDVITTNPAFGTSEVWLATGATSWGAPSTLSHGIGQVGALELADVDNNGTLDLLMTNSAGSLRLRLGVGDGSFGQEFGYGPAVAGLAMAVGDLDGDGAVDVLVSNTTDELTIMKGVGDSSFTTEDTIVVGRVIGMGLADMDDDGDLDVALAIDNGLFTTDSLGVLVNRSYGPGSPFTDVGFAKAGPSGTPVFFADGLLQPGTPSSFDLFQGSPGDIAWFPFGLSTVNLPFEGGVLVPSPDKLRLRLIGPDGRASLGGNWPHFGTSGLTLWAQWWFANSGGAFGWSGSNAVRIDVP